MEGNVRSFIQHRVEHPSKTCEEKENTAKTATCWQALQHSIKPGSLSQCFSFPLNFVVEKLVSSTA